MAAEVADGILVMPFNSERHMRERTMPAIERGLAAAGRTRDDIEVTAEVIVGVGRTDEELEAARGVRTAHRLLRLDARVPARARRRGLGRPAARAERALEAGPVGRHDQR